MKTQRLSPSSRFLVGVSTLLITLQLISHYTIGADHIFPVESQTLGDHVLNWISVGLAQLWLMALTLLAAWIGQLFQSAFPNPGKAFMWVLMALAIIGFGLYVYGCTITYWPRWFFGSCIFSAFVIGFLVHVENVSRHATFELIAVAVSLALVYTATCLLPRHRWIDFFVLMPFVYYMLLLSNDSSIKRIMEKDWVSPILIVLATVSFISAIIYLVRVKSWLHIEFLLPIWGIIVQPVIVYPLFLLCRGKSENDKKGRSATR